MSDTERSYTFPASTALGRAERAGRARRATMSHEEVRAELGGKRLCAHARVTLGRCTDCGARMVARYGDAAMGTETDGGAR